MSSFFINLRYPDCSHRFTMLRIGFLLCTKIISPLTIFVIFTLIPLTPLTALSTFLPHERYLCTEGISCFVFDNARYDIGCIVPTIGVEGATIGR